MAGSTHAGGTAAVVNAIRTGDAGGLRQLLEDNPALVHQRVDGQRTLLHVATDWPGHFPGSARTIAVLLEFGAEVNAPFLGPHAETPLHWAASSNDVDVIDVLLDHGANIEASGAVIGGGTPLADAVAFGQWQAARRLVERGAATTLWQAAALGRLDRMEPYFAAGSPPSTEQVNHAFWCACHGGQQAAAEYLLRRGADVNWVGHDGLTPLDAAKRSGAQGVIDWLRSIASGHAE